MEFDLMPGVRVRPWRPVDAESLARHANNRKVWRNLRDRFPHPYGIDDAHAYLAAVSARPLVAAIEVRGEAAGGISLHPQEDVYARSMEIGYWLGEQHWGRGIATAAARAVTEHALTLPGIVRVYAEVFAWNPASARVLEKAGYTFEGRRALAAFKDGQCVDDLLYAVVRPPA